MWMSDENTLISIIFLYDLKSYLLCTIKSLRCVFFYNGWFPNVVFI